MKKSPLKLEWVVYPSAAYEYLEGNDSNDEPVAVDVDAEVTWNIDGEHTASVSIKSRDDTDSPYRFNVVAGALFKFDLEAAVEHYQPRHPQALASIIAVNICRIIFSGVREQISMMTARGPIGPLVIEGIVLEPSDIKISSTAEPPRILRDVFKVPEEIVKQIEARAKEFSAKHSKTKKAAKKKAAKVD